jgi:hypothetical protein
MGLTSDERKLLDELNEKAKQPDAAADFEIEVYNEGKGARLPFSQGRKWLMENFGIGADETSDEGAGGSGASGGEGGSTGGGAAPSGGGTPPRSVFGGRGK